MKKLDLHWQILIGLVVGVLFGFYFSPTFKLTEDSLYSIEQENIPNELFNDLQKLENKSFSDKESLEKKIRQAVYSIPDIQKDTAMLFSRRIIGFIDSSNYVTYSRGFKLPGESLPSLSDLPGKVQEKLKKIENKSYKSKTSFREDLSILIGEQSSQKYGDRIVELLDSARFISLTPSYKLSEKSFAHLNNLNVPVVVIEKLRSITGQSFTSIEALEAALPKAIGQEAAIKYKKQILRQVEKTDYVRYISWMGTLFMRGLQMVIVPLILSSIISGVANIGNAENLGRLGLKTMSYYLLTSMFAILTGLILVNLIAPGIGADLGLSKTVEGLDVAREDFGKTLLKIVPTNIFEAFVDNEMLSIIFFAILFGFFITRVSNKSRKTLTDFFNSTFDVMMKITTFIIKFTPFGVLAIVADVVAENADNLTELAGSVGMYAVTVLAALAIHATLTLPSILRIIGRAHPLKHLKVMRSVLLTAFSTSSSGATLSLTMQAVEKRGGVSNKITSFTLPLGATINMDGTALYECVAAMFIAQAYGIELSFVEQIIVVVTALLASIGAAGIPMAGLVMISIILTAVGLPLEGMGLILAVDRILDMFRTATNVWSDSCGAVVIAKSEGETLKV